MAFVGNGVKGADVVKRLIKGVLRVSTMAPIMAIVITALLAATEIMSNDQIALITASMSVVVWALILVNYLPALVYAARNKHRVEEQNFDLGVVLIFTALAAWSFWRYTFIALGNPDWMIGHWMPNIISVMASVSGFYFLSVPKASHIGLRFTTIAVVGIIILASVGFWLLGV